MRESQAILEAVIVFVIGLFLFFGIMSIWMWGDNQIAKRQPEYNQTRVQAGVVTQNSGQPLDPDYLNTLIDQRDVLQTQLNSLGTSMENSLTELEASKVPISTELDRHQTEKESLDAEHSALAAEETASKDELAKLQKTCSMNCGDGWCDPCTERIGAINARLGEIQNRVTEINDRVDNVLVPKINRLQGVIDQVDTAKAAIEDDITPAAGLQGQVDSLDEMIANLQGQAGIPPSQKNLYWPVYTPDVVAEEDVFGVQDIPRN